MNQTLWCHCGYPVEVRTYSEGSGYIAYFVAGDEGETSHCPGCGDYLPNAYRDGQLLDRRPTTDAKLV